MMKAVIFDVDGTLVDSVDAHAHAWQDAFNAFGHDFAFEKIRSQIGKGGDQLMPVILSREEVEAQGSDIERFRAGILKARYFPTIHGFPRVRELFEKLIAANVDIVLASSAKKDELGFYKKIAGIDDLVRKKPLRTMWTSRSRIRTSSRPRLPSCLESRRPTSASVGDTPYDAEAAGKIGLLTIGVLCGGFAE